MTARPAEAPATATAADDVFTQPGAGVRFDWGLTGAAELARVCAALVVVDVLSFTTAVDVAVGRGVRVHPFPWNDQAEAYAARIGATVAVGRGAVSPDHPWSLSPLSLQQAPPVADLVLPSPNGSAICAAAAATGVPVVAGCLRNAGAVADWLFRQGFGSADAPIGVVAAGERWPDGSLRPCVEDLLGAAAVLDGLVAADTNLSAAADGGRSAGGADGGLAAAPGGLSVEAAMCLATLTGIGDLPAAVRVCVSGQELTARGFRGDVELAAQLGCSSVVPVLRAGAFGPAVA
jgi:2-phosphosulfolactate phosphatase